jgi:hypothetical protein
MPENKIQLILVINQGKNPQHGVKLFAKRPLHLNPKLIRIWTFGSTSASNSISMADPFH